MLGVWVHPAHNTMYLKVSGKSEVKVVEETEFQMQMAEGKME